MKEKIISVLKKIAVILIASIMVLGVVPISMLTMRSHTADAKSAFLRLMPEEEASVTRSKETQSLYQNAGIFPVGGGSDAYLRFDLQELLHHKGVKEIKEASLRLTFIPTDIDTAMSVRVWLMPSADWNRNMRYSEKPATLGEIKLAELSPTPEQDAQAIEIDLMPYLLQWIEAKNSRLSLHLDAVGTGISGVFAGTHYEDALYRPCLKVVTGEATDPDSEDISKAWLEKSVQSGMDRRDGMFCVGNGNDVYLKYQLKPENIRGAMYQSGVRLALQRMDADAELHVCKLSQGQWNDDAYLPQGEEMPIGIVTAEELSQTGMIDVTDAINDAYARGETSLTLRMTGGKTGEIVFEENPALQIRVSDHADVIAVTEAAVYALEDNPSADAIAGNLSESYTTEQGVRAEIRWNT